MKPKLHAFFQRWLGKPHVLHRLRTVPSDQKLIDDCGATGEPSRPVKSAYMLTGGLCEDRPNGLTHPDRRASDRVADRSSLLVIGQDAEGCLLSKLATIHDVGLGGISFFLDRPLAVGHVLDLTLCSPEFGALEDSGVFCVQATVLRSARPSRPVETCLIAAEFNGEFTVLNEFDVDTRADALRDAIRFDEQIRQGPSCELIRELERRR